jgi:hypothetical protein
MDDEPKLTLTEALAMMERVWDEVERTILEHVRAEVIAEGFNEADVGLVIEKTARRLREGRPARLETARQMLEAGATNLQ